MGLEAIEGRDGGVLLRVRVQPKASRNAVAGLTDECCRIALTAPPVEGAANEALIEFLAKVLAVKKRQVTLVSGAHARSKCLHIAGLSPNAARHALIAARG